MKITIELLAGIPSVVYGLLGILFLRNWVYRLLTPFDPLSGDTLLTAGLLVGVMILPTVMTLTDDALRGVPALQRQAARGLGLNVTETIVSVVVPQAWPGIAAAVLLAFGRSLGEMIRCELGAAAERSGGTINSVRADPQRWIQRPTLARTIAHPTHEVHSHAYRRTPSRYR